MAKEETFMTNPKIEKVNIAISKTKTQIADFQAKLKDLENQKIMFENEEIVAMFRREKFNEDDLAKLRQKKKEQSVKQETAKQTKVQTLQTKQEAIFNEPDNE